MKKFVAMILSFSLLLSLLSIPVGATSDLPVGETEVSTDDAFYETHWLFENGEFRQISEEVYRELLTPQYYPISEKETGETISPMYTVSETYTVKSASTYYGSKTPVSPWSYYPASPIAASSVTTYASHSTTITATVKTQIRNAITAKLGVTVKESSGSATGNIAGSLGDPKKGMYSRIVFQPKMANVSGTVKKITNSNNGQRVENYDVTSKYPVTLPSGLTDGIYSIQYSTKPS